MSASVVVQRAKKGHKGVGMEGSVARWYARNTRNSTEQFKREAGALAAELAQGSSVLEVAPGPGYLAIELARLGDYKVVGLDISKTFVELATENAKNAGVAVAFELGNAAAMPFQAESFDLVVCRAAFKNFSEPTRALAEMHRVLKSGGKAVVIDLRPDASSSDIAAAVAGMNLGWLDSLITKLTFKHMLLKRAHSKESIRRMAAQTPFETCQIREEKIGLEITLMKS